ncbi:MAG: DUF998 domain-containing protein [Candidatus Bathyarchaeota archaeon]|nr:DUF998 domain-containing protein [Candidatus Bathyarchaeota archaeon]
MENRVYALFGFFGPLVLYVSIAASAVLSPWFSWETNMLSDLGNTTTSDVAALFNGGMLLSGFLLMIYAFTAFKAHAKYSSYCLLASTFFVQLIAVFNESYGQLHFFAAVPHFLFLSLTSLVYTVEKRSRLALATFSVAMLSWLIYALGIFNIGIAVPETISKIVVAWIMYSAIRIYVNQTQ